MADEVALADALQLVSYARDRNTGENREIADLVARALASGAQGTADIAVGKANAAQSTADAANTKADANATALTTKYGFGLGTRIPDGADANDYKTLGKYHIPSNVAADTISNLPGEYHFAGALYVEETYTSLPHSLGAVTQRYVTSENKMWTRLYDVHSDKWSEWTCYGGIDAPIAEGDSGIWHYTKWANGWATCIAQLATVFTQASTAGGFKYSGAIDISFPFSFASTPLPFAQGEYWSDLVRISIVEKSSIRFYNAHPTIADGQSQKSNFCIVGRWK